MSVNDEALCVAECRTHEAKQRAVKATTAQGKANALRSVATHYFETACCYPMDAVTREKYLTAATQALMVAELTERHGLHIEGTL